MSTALAVRVSTERQPLAHTIAQQGERLIAHVHAPGETLRPEHIFRDDGDRGATLNRPGLDHLRDRVKEGAVARVVLARPDRLARNSGHQLLRWDEFARVGCQVAFLAQPMGQAPQAHRRLHIRGAVAASERPLSAEPRRRGRQRKRQAGVLRPWTVPPYGDRLPPARPRDPAGVPSEPTDGPIVQEVFARDLAADGTRRGLAQPRLRLGIKSPRGNRRWRAASLHGLLSTPGLSGDTRRRPAPGASRTAPALGHAAAGDPCRQSGAHPTRVVDRGPHPPGAGQSGGCCSRPNQLGPQQTARLSEQQDPCLPSTGVGPWCGVPVRLDGADDAAGTSR
jgi:DNA invertase Pin-like site-specific DNA recombinase